MNSLKAAKLERSISFASAGIDRRPRAGTRQIATFMLFDPRAQPTVEMVVSDDSMPEENDEVTATRELDQSAQ